MRLIRANQAKMEQINQYLEKNATLIRDELLHTGYVVEIGEQIEGSFILELVEDNSYWLKQLYITQQEAGKLPLLLESILALAKQQQIKRVYANSNQLLVDIVLEALQFHQQTGKTLINKHSINKGKWWSHDVS